MSSQKEEESVWAERRSYEDGEGGGWHGVSQGEAPGETTAAKEAEGFQPPVPGQG